MSIQEEIQTAVRELFSVAPTKKGQILVVGCSTSEILGKKIGTSGDINPASTVFEVLRREANVRGMYLACQCCEHLNRALVVERACAERYNLSEVMAVPHEHAGGSFATAAYRGFDEPCLVEELQADWGLDIGSTLIGMHLKRVAVPVRLSVKAIGEAPLTAARVRPKYTGGPRAKYE